MIGTRGDVRLGGDEVEELGHHLLGVEQPLVHVDVEDVRAAVDLLLRDGERRLEIAALIELRELRRAGDVGALADHDEVRVVGADRSSGSRPLRGAGSGSSRAAARAAGSSCTASAIARM